MNKNKEELKIIWAALCGMVWDIHQPMDQLTKEEWELAEKMMKKYDEEINK